MSEDSSSLWQQDIRSYRDETLYDKKAKEIEGDTFVDRVKKSKLAGLFYFLYIVFFPLLVLIEVAIIMTPGYGYRHRPRGLFITRILSRKKRR